MPLKGGRWRGALRMLALFPARSAQVVPARPPSSHEKGGIQREQKTHTRNFYTVFDDTTTISKGGRCVLSHHRARPHMHTLTSPSLTDPLPPLPLTSLLSPCCASRCWSATTIVLEQVFHLCSP